MEITITRQHVVRALLAGACSVPRVGMPIRRLTPYQLEWAEDAGIVDAADREAVWADCKVEVLGGSLTGLPLAWRSGSGSGDGSGYGYGDVAGAGDGEGYGYENGYGYDYGYGEGYGDGYGNGYGDGSGYGYGDVYGYGDGDGYGYEHDGSGYGCGEEHWRRIAEILTEETEESREGTMTTQNEQKRRTITLTDRPPVSIAEDEWPIIARGDGDSWSGPPGDGRYYQALRRGEIDEYTLRVRQHADGRAIVYGVVRTGDYKTEYEDWRGGELLEPGADIARAIRRVAEGRMPDRVIRECIADLPAEEV